MTTTTLDVAAVEGVPMMDRQEATAYLDMMRDDLAIVESGIGNFRARALDFREREGWRALGYAGFVEAINAELGTQYSKSYLSRLLRAAEIERVLELPIGNMIPEAQLRPLAELDAPEAQRAAWQQASVATNGTPTAKAVQAAVDQIKPKPTTTTPPGIPDDIRLAAGRLELLIERHGDGLLLRWPEERTDLYGPQSVDEARAWLHDEAPKTALDRLNSLLLADLRDAGYVWESALPPVIAHADGWRGDAPTVERALNLARDRMVVTEREESAPWQLSKPINAHQIDDQARRISDGARRRAIGLMRQLAPLMRLITTEDQCALAEAIDDLNDCKEGTEGEHWLSVGWALLDVVPTLESEGIHVDPAGH